MSAFQLYIGGQRVEQFEDESVSLTQTIQDVRDISKVFTDFSKPFTLPASKNNNKIFRHYYRFNIENGYAFDARKKLNARIELNHNPFREGKIKLEGVDLESGRPKAYRVTFFGRTINLKDLLGDTDLSSLEWLTQFNTNYTGVKIRSTMIDQNGLTFTVNDPRDTTESPAQLTYSKALIVPLISNTMRLFYDSSSGTNAQYNNADGTPNAAAGGNLYPDGSSPYTSDNVHGVYYEDLTYAIKVHLIVKAIESLYPQIRFSDDFFNLTNSPQTYQNLYMLLQNKEGRVFVEEDLTLTKHQIVGWNYKAEYDVRGLNQLFVTRYSGLQWIGTNYNYDAEVEAEFLTASNHPTFDLVVKQNGTEITRKTFQESNNVRDGRLSFIAEERYALYTFEIETLVPFTMDSFGLSLRVDNYPYSGGTINQNFTITTDIAFNITDNIPRIKIIDFLTSLFKMFNLTAFEKDGVINVKTLESFYASGTTRDITELIDPTKSSTDTALPFRDVHFKFDNEGSKLAKQHQQKLSTEGERWGELKYTLNEALDSNNETFNVEVAFDHLKYERLIDANNNAKTSVQFGWMADEKGEPYFESPVLFLGLYQPLSSPIRFLDSISTDGINQINSLWIPSNSTHLSFENTLVEPATSTRENINFRAELNEYTASNQFTDTLFEKYYRFYIEGIFDVNKRLIKHTARLPQSFLLNYSLADLITIQGEKYRINKITTNLLTGESQLELLNETTTVSATTPIENVNENEEQTTNNQDELLNNVLFIRECATPNGDYEADRTLRDLNLPNDRRVVDLAGNTYTVTGNGSPNTYTSKTIQDTGNTNCQSGVLDETPSYYGLQKCSDGTTNHRTSQSTSALTLNALQQVQDSSSNIYVVSDSSSKASDNKSAVSVTAVSPVAYNCPSGGITGGVETFYFYTMTPCDTGTVEYAKSRSSGLANEKRLYNNRCYTLTSTTNNTGTIDLDSNSVTECQVVDTCPKFYYRLQPCTGGGTAYLGYSIKSTKQDDTVEYNSTPYVLKQTSNQAGTIDIDALPSTTCPTIDPDPTPGYYLFSNCNTVVYDGTSYPPYNAAWISNRTTDQESFTADAGLNNAQVVKDSDNNCYVVRAEASGDLPSYKHITVTAKLDSSGAATFGCPASPCTGQTVYYHLYECSTGQTYITQQTTDEITLSSQQRIYTGSGNTIKYYYNFGTIESGTPITANFTTTTDTGCVQYGRFQQCGTNTIYASYRDLNQVIALGGTNQYIYRGTDNNLYKFLNSGTALDGNEYNLPRFTIEAFYNVTDCANVPSQATVYYALTKCSDGSETYRTSNAASTYTFDVGAIVVDTSSNHYTVSGYTENTTTHPNSVSVNKVNATGCPNISDPDQPTTGPYYAIFAECDDQTNILSVVSQAVPIGTNWVVREGLICYAFQSYDLLGGNQVDVSNLQVFQTLNTTGGNCIDCQTTTGIGGPDPEIPVEPSCNSISVYRTTSNPILLCTATKTGTVYANGTTLSNSSILYSNSTCSSAATTGYYQQVSGGGYYYWNGSSLAGPYYNNCP